MFYPLKWGTLFDEDRPLDPVWGGGFRLFCLFWANANGVGFDMGKKPQLISWLHKKTAEGSPAAVIEEMEEKTGQVKNHATARRGSTEINRREDKYQGGQTS